jgi:branched-subunit amino acid ABC-type transport system permease component
METLVLWVTVIVMVGVASALIGTLVLSFRREPRVKKLWANFGLSLAFCGFFLVTWVAHALAEWQVYAEQQRTHSEPTSLSGYLVEFGTGRRWRTGSRNSCSCSPSSSSRPC